MGLRRGRERDDALGERVRGFRGSALVGPEQVRHDAQHPLHERPGPHPDPGQLAHHRRVADRPHEEPGDAESRVK